MQALLGCLGIILLIVLIIWAIKNFVGLAGIGLAIWGIYEWKVNRKLGAKSKAPAIIILIGLIICGSWFAFAGSDTETKPPETTVTDENKVVTTSETKNNDLAQKNNQPEEQKLEQTTLSQGNQQTKETQNNTDKSTETSKFIVATVTDVVDGDTMQVNLNGKKETIRLLLVDTPETKDPNEPVQPFGPEATKFAETTLEGKQVKLEFDGPERDKYDRLLVYLWIGDKIFNQMLLEKGLARVAYVYDPPYTHYDQFIQAENKAKQAKIGIWSIPNYVQSDGFHEEVAKKKQETKQVTSQGSEHSKPKNQNQIQQSTQKVLHFNNCDEARAAGVAPIYKGEPGYSRKLDRDGDGIACE